MSDAVKNEHESNACLIVRVSEMESGRLILKAEADDVMLDEGSRLYALDTHGDIHEAQVERFSSMDRRDENGQVIHRGNLCIFSLPLAENVYYDFYQIANGKEPARVELQFGFLGKLNHRVSSSYWRSGDFIIKLIGDRLTVSRYSIKRQIACELGYIKQIRRKGYKDGANKISLRTAALLSSVSRKKRIWLLLDRNYYACDSATALFKYLSTQDMHDVDYYLVLSKSSPDYERMKQYGKVVDPFSRKFKILFLNAEYLISAHAEKAVVQPFKGHAHVLSDLFNYKYIYLQHGVLHGNLDSWLNVLAKNIKLFAVCTQMEKDILLNGAYGYDESVVRMLGMTRFDAYYEYEAKKKIAFMPTWRKNIAGELVEDGRTHAYVENFGETEYCKFYNALINDRRLTEAMKEYGYTGDFYLHPCFEKQTEDFAGNDIITFHKEGADYPKVLGEAALLVTDYSGVQYDFAYFKKPLIYSQFDTIDEGEHSYTEKYVKYDTDGFGPVTKTITETVDSIIEQMKKGCVMEDKYKKRVDEFFYYHDNQNCKRVFDELIKGI